MSHHKTLIFLHMSKAGGSTLNHVLDWNYDRTRTITVYKQIPPLIALPDDEKRQIQCLKGMVFYGIHRYLPQECEYITILRHPIERIISHYFYLSARKRRLGEPIYDMSLDDVLELEPFWPTYQLRLLVGGGSIESVLHDPLPDNALEIAKQNLARHFVLAGVLDYYDETLLMMKQTFGWTRAFYARQNVGQARAPRGDIPASTRQRLEEACALEMQLYRHVKQQTEALIAQQDASFQAELARLRQANARFERLYRWAEPIRGTPLWGWARRLVRGANRRG
jgi:PAS domain-containing protein